MFDPDKTKFFDADKGLFHFVFANDDTYIKDSLIQLDRQHNLYYELKDKNYDTVLFIDMVGSNYQVSCGDESASQLYNRCRKLKFKDVMGGFFGAGSNPNLTMARILDKMLSESSRTAFVFSLEAMASFQGLKEAEDIFIEHREHNSMKNIVLIVSSTYKEDSFKKLTDPYGIFQSDVFPEIKEIFASYDNVRVYEHMKPSSVGLAGRVVYMNHMSCQELKNLVFAALMKTPRDLSKRLNCLEDYADFLWLLIHSERFLRQTLKKAPRMRSIFSDIEKRCFRTLKNDLEQDEAYVFMDEMIANIRGNQKDKPLRELLNLDDTSEEKQCYLSFENKWLPTLRALGVYTQTPKEMSLGMRENLRGIYKKLDCICLALSRPYLSCDGKNHENLQDEIRSYVKNVKDADAKRDYETMKIGVDALYYLVCECEKETDKLAANLSETQIRMRYENQERCIKMYREALECKKYIPQQDEKAEEYMRDIRGIAAKMREKLDTIRQIEKDHPDVKQKAQSLLMQIPWVKTYMELLGEYNDLDKNKKLVEANLDMVRTNMKTQQERHGLLVHQINMMEDAQYIRTIEDEMDLNSELAKIEEKIKRAKLKNEQDRVQIMSMENKTAEDFNLDEELRLLEESSNLLNCVELEETMELLYDDADLDSLIF